MSYYATHPQSYYGQGLVNWDFVGIARDIREQALPGVPHIHFNGASGNVAAGKYNNGSEENRPVLAGRLAAGIEQAWETRTKHAVSAEDLMWRTLEVSLPVRDGLMEEQLQAILQDESLRATDRIRAARDLSFVRRVHAGHQISVSCLQLCRARILHMPGELFVEYQLAAQNLRPQEFVAMAAYGDYGPGYIGTKIAYSQGGYETGRVSRVAPEVETVLMQAVEQLLNTPDTTAAEQP